MSIEIKQLLIKSNIVQPEGGGATAAHQQQDSLNAESLKDEVLAECRKLILSLLRERGER